MIHSHGTECFSYIQIELFLSNPSALCTPVLAPPVLTIIETLQNCDWIALSLLFPRLKKSNYFSPSFFNPLNVLVASCWILSGFSTSLWNWGSKDGTQYSRCGPTRAWRIITSHDLLARLLLMQSKAQFVLLVWRVPIPHPFWSERKRTVVVWKQ